MKNKFFLTSVLLILFIISISAQEKIYEQTLTKKLKVNYGSNQSLHISSPKGSIQLIPGDDIIIEAVFLCSGTSKELVKNALDSSTIDLKEENGTINIDAKIPGNYLNYNQVITNETQQIENFMKSISKKDGAFAAITVNFYVTIPEKISKIKLDNSFGNIDISGIKSDIEINSKHGEINIENLKGNIDIFHSYGDISLLRIEGDINIENSHGKVYIKKAKDIQVKNSFKGIIIEEVEGNIQVENSNAPVELKKLNLQKSNPKLKRQINVQNKTGDIILYPEDKPTFKIKAKSYSSSESSKEKKPGVKNDSDEASSERVSGTIGGTEDNVSVELQTVDAEILIIFEEDAEEKK
ncbi:MAG: hypothetical protein PHV06_10320 [bacterium]|nr:hypothetical protein [bacterium]